MKKIIVIINNDAREYQKINLVAKPTASRDLSKLTDIYKVFKNSGFGAGSVYELVT